MKIKAWKETTEQIEIDVEFPIYRHQWGGGDDLSVRHYTRIAADLSAIHITLTTGDLIGGEITFQDDYYFDRSPLDYHLGRGKYACTEQEFWAALNQLREWIVLAEARR